VPFDSEKGKRDNRLKRENFHLFCEKRRRNSHSRVSRGRKGKEKDTSLSNSNERKKKKRQEEGKRGLTSGGGKEDDDRGGGVLSPLRREKKKGSACN